MKILNAEKGFFVGYGRDGWWFLIVCFAFCRLILSLECRSQRQIVMNPQLRRIEEHEVTQLRWRILMESFICDNVVHRCPMMGVAGAA